MVKVLFIQELDLLTFYRRRVSRVFPSVVTYVLVIAILFIASGNEIAYAELFSAITFTNNYFVSSNWSMPFGHIWSLSVEEHSYIILMLAAYWCRSRGANGAKILGFVLSIILMAIAVYSIPQLGAKSWQLRTEVASFGIFISGFLFLVFMSRKHLIKVAWAAPLTLCIGILFHWWSVPSQARLIIGWGALALSINLMSAAPRWFSMIFESQVLRQLGIYSFSLYLWQQPFYQLVHHYGFSPTLGLLFSLIIGVSAYYLIENPMRTFLNKHWAKKPDVVNSESKLEIA